MVKEITLLGGILSDLRAGIADAGEITVAFIRKQGKCFGARQRHIGQLTCQRLARAMSLETVERRPDCRRDYPFLRFGLLPPASPAKSAYAIDVGIA